MRIEAIKHGLPTRRIESWHYTDLRRLLNAVPDFDPAAVRQGHRADRRRLRCFADSNGVSGTKLPADRGRRPSQRLSEKLTDGSIAPGLDPYGSDDAIGALNTAFVADGYFVDIADGTELEKPIELQNLQAGGQVHVRLPVRVGAGAKAVIVERQAGEGAALVSSVSQLVLGEGAEVTWLIVQEQPDTATHLGQFKAHLGKNSKLTLFVMNAGGKLVRQEIVVRTTGEGADFKLRGINLLAGDTHTDVTMVLDHAVPHTASTEVIRNVVTGKARGVFQGRINVHQYAQKTDAKMACNTLLSVGRWRVLDQAGARNLRRRRRLRPWRDRHRDRPQPSVLPDGARHRREDRAWPAGQSLRRRSDRGTGRRGDRRGAGAKLDDWFVAHG